MKLLSVRINCPPRAGQAIEDDAGGESADCGAGRIWAIILLFLAIKVFFGINYTFRSASVLVSMILRRISRVSKISLASSSTQQGRALTGIRLRNFRRNR